MKKDISKLEKKVIKELQDDLPFKKRPYKHIADKLEISRDRLFQIIEQLKKEDILRRIGAILYHRNAGYKFNGMVVWEISQKNKRIAGKIMASYQQISHIFERPTYEDWPYNIFSMIHAQSNEEVEKIVNEIKNKVRINDYKILYSTEELKKVSMKYFHEEN